MIRQAFRRIASQLDNRTFVVLIIVAPSLVVLLFVLLLLKPWIPQVPETFTCDLKIPETATAQSFEIQSDETKASQSAEERLTNFFFVKDQVIITGPKTAVDKVAKTLALEQKLIRDCEIGFFRRLLGAGDLDTEYFPFSRREQSKLVMRLYGTDGKSAVEVVNDINEKYSQAHVFAEPNYLIGVLGQSQCGSPHEAGGSPHEAGGSPFEVFSSPDEPGGSPVEAGSRLATPKDFWEQWAFGHIGAGPSLEGALAMTSSMPTGEGVHVAVFDTSPFVDEETETQIEKAIESGQDMFEDEKHVKWVSQSLEEETFELKVSYPDPTRLNDLIPDEPDKAKKIPDHGLFVASLVHAVAPESEIELIRVLNEYGCGDLETLNESLIQFIVRKRNERGTLKGDVLNFSLGIHKPRSVHKSSEEWIAALMGVEPEDLQRLERDRIESLATVLFVAERQGAVVVAAAGNESTQDKALPMHIPADYPFVIGVAASNMERERACFSNWGDVAAPGGDGGPDEENPSEFPCKPKHEACQGICDDALISLFWNPPAGVEASPTSSPPYYTHWSGTSFSAPLVSGLAALVLDAGASKTICGTTWVSPDRVFEAIRCGAPTPDGVVSVADTLYRCLP